ncbi:YbaN family protein [Veronia pacifica]|uniref:Inner membrane protein n=1 Tax=Veronia pacifica TaxID=1080227 RepID=A0A1C3ERF8_9GAMM|nr:YbaN family protein [Veronia pacifica]ODA35806.1 hypothetical protein A8L45_01855 [Veronia pacifica]
MKNNLKRWILLFFGWLWLVVGLIGIFVPLLPTTPFLLLATACFINSSPRIAEWLLNHPKYGPTIVNWREHGAVTKKIKRRASFFIVISFTISILISPILWVKWMLVAFCATLLVWFNRLPESDAVAPVSENS